jgi:ABC-2 type transport system ATP-binding protein
MTGTPLILIRNLTRNFGSLCAINRMNLSITDEIFGILGPNGSGKTTTVLMLTTLLSPSSGTAEICGYDICKAPHEVRKIISYVPQDMAVDTRLTGRENVMLYAELYGITDPAAKTEEVLRVLDLSSRADEFAKVYSGGMRRRLELAQALVHQPRVLFLDEPTVGLDVAARKKIWEYIRALRNKGMGILVTTHYMDEADRYCDRVAILNKGEIIAIDTPLQLKQKISMNVVTATVIGDFTGISVPGVQYIKKDEDELVFHAMDGPAAVPLIKDSLAERGLVVTGMTVRAPSLDDVFLKLVGCEEDTSPFDLSSFRNKTGRR